VSAFTPQIPETLTIQIIYELPASTYTASTMPLLHE
jgi:hypothetical protein